MIRLISLKFFSMNCLGVAALSMFVDCDIEFFYKLSLCLNYASCLRDDVNVLKSFSWFRVALGRSRLLVCESKIAYLLWVLSDWTCCQEYFLVGLFVIVYVRLQDMVLVEKRVIFCSLDHLFWLCWHTSWHELDRANLLVTLSNDISVF